MTLHTYQNTNVQLQILTKGTRESIINWLCWNDPNGIWTDDDSVAEDKQPLTLEAAQYWMLQATDDERTGLPSLRKLFEEST